VKHGHAFLAGFAAVVIGKIFLALIVKFTGIATM
jgi:hypothetical protein